MASVKYGYLDYDDRRVHHPDNTVTGKALGDCWIVQRCGLNKPGFQAWLMNPSRMIDPHHSVTEAQKIQWTHVVDATDRIIVKAE